MSLLSCCLILLLCLHINSQVTLPPTYRHLAAEYCYIEDYAKWLKEQESLEYFLRFARFFDANATRIKDELERYRLQRECLKILERLPILVGGG